MHPSSRHVTVVLACLVALVVPAACSSGSSDGAKATTTTAPATTTTTTKPTSQGGVTDPPILEHPVGIYRDLTVKACDPGPGRVTASGSVKNSAKTAKDIVIVVRWVNPKGNAVIDLDTAVITDLGPGKSHTWQLSGTVPGKARAECSFVAQAGTAS